MRPISLIALAALLLLFATCGPAAEPEPAPADTPASATPQSVHVGTWVLNVAKSSYSPGPPPKSQTLAIEAWGDDGITYSADGVGGDGMPTHTEFQARFDGQDYPFVGSPDADTLAYAATANPNNLEATLKLKGAPVIMAKVVVSEDGRTRTVTQTGKDAQGRDVNIVALYDKQ